MLSTGHAGGMTLETVYPSLHSSQIKTCHECHARFTRIPVPERKLADGSMLNPNDYCTKCEAKLVNQAKVNKEECDRFRIEMDSAPRCKRQFTIGELSRMDRECLRKDMFDSMKVAKLVARRMRGRKGNHGAGAPVEAYRCTTKIDPEMYPERAKPHYHVGAVRRALKL